MIRKRPLIHFVPFVAAAVLAPAASSALAPETPQSLTGPPTALASEDFGELLVVVREGELGGPVTAVFLRLEGPEPRTGVTDAEGTFRFERLLPGTYTVRAEHLAYGSVEVEVEVAGGDGTTRAEIHLRSRPIALDPLEVEVERGRPTWGPLERVYERVEWQQRLGLGSFITREEIENRIATRVTDLLRGMPGVRVVPGWPSPGIVMTRARIYEGGCRTQIYLDGVRVTGRGGGIDDFVHPTEVELIEVYRGLAQTPAEFGGYQNRCGVVAVWTRRGF